MARLKIADTSQLCLIFWLLGTTCLADGPIASRSSEHHNDTTTGAGAPLKHRDLIKALQHALGTGCVDWVPSQRLVDLFQNISREVQTSLGKRNLKSLSEQQLLELPSVLLYLLPAQLFHQAAPSSLAALVRNYPDDAVLATKLVDTLNITHRQLFFLERLEKINLNDETSDMIAATMAQWWPVVDAVPYHMLEAATRAGKLLIAHLPTHFLSALSGESASRILMHLRNWMWDSKPVEAWHQKPWSVKRGWSDLMYRNKYPKQLSSWKSKDLEKLEFLLEGATADELNDLRPIRLNNQDLLFAKLSKLQAQVIFKLFFRGTKLNSTTLQTILPIVFQLGPQDLQKFDKTECDFRILSGVIHDQKVSFTTARQIVESMIAQSIVAKRLPGKDLALWGDGIQHLSKFVFAIPVSHLRPYKSVPLSPLVLNAVDSDELTKSQAYLLTAGSTALTFNKSEAIKAVRGMLKALPTDSLIKRRAGMIPIDVLLHLLSSWPDTTVLRSLALLQKARTLIGETDVLEAMLTNKNPAQFFSLLPSRTTTQLAANVSNILKLESFGHHTAIEKLPESVLSTLLASERSRLKLKRWSVDNIMKNSWTRLALAGLSCNDITIIETTDFVNIMRLFNSRRLAIGKGFPKILQYCSQTALLRYLEMKATWMSCDPDPSKLLDLLEPFEIKAFKGFILGSLPIDAIRASIKREDILKSIGELPLPEMLLALSDKHPQDHAKLLLKNLGNPTTEKHIAAKELFSLGNLVHFLQPSDIKNINASAFKILMESKEGPNSRLTCAGIETKRAWFALVTQAFGQPEVWTPGILSTLGDFLIVVPPLKLDQVPKKSWMKAADSLAQDASHHIHMEWPGEKKPTAFYKVCLKFLKEDERLEYTKSVRRLARHYVVATQALLDSVKTASELLVEVSDSKITKNNTRRMKPIPMLVESLQPIEVLLAEEDTPTVDNTSDSEGEADHNHEHVKPPDSVIQKMEPPTTMESHRLKPIPIHLKNQSLIAVLDVPDTELDYDNETELNSSGNFFKSTGSADHITQLPSLPTVKPVVVTQKSIASTAKLNTDTEAETKININPGMETPMEQETATTARGITETGMKSASANASMTFLHTATASPKMKREIFLGPDKRQELKVQNLDPEEPFTEMTEGELDNSVESTDPFTDIQMSCEAIRAVGDFAELAIRAVDIERWSTEELLDCLEILGSLDLGRQVQQKVWSIIQKEKLDINLADIGNLVKGMSLSDIDSVVLKLSNPSSYDTLFLLGSKLEDEDALESLAKKFMTHSENQSPSVEILFALGHITCYLPTSVLRWLIVDKDMFLDSVPGLNAVSGCPYQCLRELIRIANKTAAFGTLDTWTAQDVETLGVLMSGLTKKQWELLTSNTNNPLTALQPSAVACIPSADFKLLSAEQLSTLSPMAVGMVTNDQLSHLSSEQRSAILKVKTLEPVVNLQRKSDKSGSGQPAFSLFVFFITTLIYFLGFR